MKHEGSMRTHQGDFSGTRQTLYLSYFSPTDKTRPEATPNISCVPETGMIYNPEIVIDFIIIGVFGLSPVVGTLEVICTVNSRCVWRVLMCA